jgi:hypothetical protein
MEEETSSLLVELFPALEFSEVVPLGTLLARGRAASKSQLDQTVPWLWERVEEMVQAKAAYPEAFTQLKGRAGGSLWFGVRRLSEPEMSSEKLSQTEKDLPSQEAGSPTPEAADEPDPPRDFLLWFLAGLKAGGGRFLAVEVDAGRKGYATYVYRCLEAESDAAAYAATASTISRAMVALNFYREPVYAPQRDIDSGRFAEYKLAVRKLKYLANARALFVGRVIHSSPENWIAGLETLLSSAGSS